MWKTAIEKMITRLSEIALDRGDYAYFPAGSFLPGGRYPADAPMPTGIMAERAEWAHHSRARAILSGHRLMNPPCVLRES